MDPHIWPSKSRTTSSNLLQQLCEDTGCNPEDLPEAMNDREKWREMVRDIRAGGTTWWWWWWYLSREYVCCVKCKQYHSGFELWSQCLIPSMITIAPTASPIRYEYKTLKRKIYKWMGIFSPISIDLFLSPLFGFVTVYHSVSLPFNKLC